MEILVSDLTPKEQREVWELMKREHRLSDHELLEMLEADALAGGKANDRPSCACAHSPATVSRRETGDAEIWPTVALRWWRWLLVPVGVVVPLVGTRPARWRSVAVAARRTGEEIPRDRACCGGGKVDRRRAAVIRRSNFELTVEFHQAIGQLPKHQRPGPAARRATIQLRERLIREEAKEAIEALEALRHADTPACPDLVEHVAKELADVLCVTYGAAAALGIPMDAVYAEVHASNMTKVGGPVRADGKMLKGDGYRPPDLSQILSSR